MASASVTMDDLKEFKESLNLSMTTKMREMRGMIAQLLQAQKASTPPPSPEEPESPNAADGAAKAAADAIAKASKEDLGSEDTSTSTKKGENKESYNETPPWFSPNPPIYSSPSYKQQR